MWPYEFTESKKNSPKWPNDRLNDNMDLDELKNKWQSINIRTEALEQDTKRLASNLASGRVTNATTELVKYYRSSGIYGLCLPALAPMIVIILQFPIWIAIIYALMGIIMTILNFRFANDISKFDFINQPVVTAMAATMRLRSRQRKIRLTGIVLGLVVLSSMVSEMLGPDDEMLIIGMLCGLAIGVPTAVYKDRRAMKLSKHIQEELRGYLKE